MLEPMLYPDLADNKRKDDFKNKGSSSKELDGHIQTCFESLDEIL